MANRRSMRPASAMLAALALCAGLGTVPADAGPVYRQPLWFEWNKAELDVLIIPPTHGQLVNAGGVLNGLSPDEVNPLVNSYMGAITNSIKDWNRAIRAYGPRWLRRGLDIDVKVLGIDDVSHDELRTWEILIFTDETQADALGTAYHLFDGRCIVRNSKLFVTSLSYTDMFNINSQEYGHCLGLLHVNEADPPNPDNAAMRYDPMNGFYPHAPGGVDTMLHCVSNLNVKGVVEVFRTTLDRGEASANGVVPRDRYKRISDCG